MMRLDDAIVWVLSSKSVGLLRHGNASEQQIIALKLKKAGINVSKVCKQVCAHTSPSAARSRYYRRLVQKPIDVDAIKLKVAVRQIHTQMHATYGSRRMCAELNAQGVMV